VWTRRRRRSVVPMAVPERRGEGRADDAVPGCFDVEERGTDVEAHAEDAEEGAWWRQTQRSEHRWVCGGEIKGLGFRGLATLKKKSSNNGHGDISYIWIINTINAHRYCDYAHRYRFFKNKVWNRLIHIIYYTIR
jgi:hypothetical protein